MKSKTIGYSESKEFVDYSTGLKTWRKVWLEAEPDIYFELPHEGSPMPQKKQEDADLVFQQVKQKVQEWLNGSSQKENFEGNGFSAGVTDGVGSYIPPPIITDGERPTRDTVDFILEDIQSCKEIKVLETYRLIAKKNPILEEAYYNKLKSLEDNK